MFVMKQDFSFAILIILGIVIWPKNSFRYKMTRASTIVVFLFNLQLILAQVDDKTATIVGYTNITITKTNFEKTTATESIKIIRNSIDEIESNAFAFVPNLNTLVMSQNSIKKMPNHFEGLEKLKEFIFEETKVGKPETVQRMLTHFAKTNKDVQHLSINDGGITNFDWILSFAQLKRLVLIRNLIQMLPYDLSSRLPNLQYFDVTFNNLTWVDDKVFKGFSKLVGLKLAHNNIQTVSESAFEDLSQLEVLSLQNNSINEVKDATFKGLHNLLAISLAENRLDQVPDDVFLYTPNLDQLVLKENTITLVGNNAFRGLDKLTELDISNNYIEAINGDMFKHLPNLVKLKLRRNNIGVLSANTISAMPKLANIDFSYNVISRIEDEAFNDIISLEQLNLSHNEIETWNPKAFKNVKKVVGLNLEGNRIRIIQTLAFHNLGVRKLDFKNNLITRIEPDGFKGLTSLELLGLSDNSIEKFEKNTFNELHKLTCVDLMNNKVQTPELFQQLPKVKYVFTGKTWNTKEEQVPRCYNILIL